MSAATDHESLLTSDTMARLGLALPPVPVPVAAYSPAVMHGDLIYTSGQLPVIDGQLEEAGLVGATVSPDRAAELARTCTLNALSAAADLAGGIDNIESIVKAVVFVASADDFTGQPLVANGASDLLIDLLGECGRHARSAIGVKLLPLGAPVEVELVAARKSQSANCGCA